MAEFKTIMEKVIFMCQNTKCTECPIYDHVYDNIHDDCPFVEDMFYGINLETVEREVEKWAEKHKTPTWLEYLTSIGVAPSFSVQDQGSPAQTILTFNAINTTNIPYDIALKLGIVKGE